MITGHFISQDIGWFNVFTYAFFLWLIIAPRTPPHYRQGIVEGSRFHIIIAGNTQRAFWYTILTQQVCKFERLPSAIIGHSSPRNFTARMAFPLLADVLVYYRWGAFIATYTVWYRLYYKTSALSQALLPAFDADEAYWVTQTYMRYRIIIALIYRMPVHKFSVSSVPHTEDNTCSQSQIFDSKRELANTCFYYFHASSKLPLRLICRFDGRRHIPQYGWVIRLPMVNGNTLYGFCQYNFMLLQALFFT